MTSWTAPKTYTAGSALTASELNTHTRDNLLHLYERVVGYSPTMSSDQTRDNSAFGNVTELTFPVASGKNYGIIGAGTWKHSSTAGGLILGFDHPGGNCRGLFEYTGETSTTSNTRDWVTAIDTGSGVATAQASDSVYAWWIPVLRYQCTSSGTFALRFARNTGGIVTLQAGSSLFVTSD